MNPKELLDICAALPTLHSEAYNRAKLRARGKEFADFVAGEEKRLRIEYEENAQLFKVEVYDKINLSDGRPQTAPPVKCKSCREPFLRGYTRIADPAAGREYEFSQEELHALEWHTQHDAALVSRLEEILSKEIVRREAEKAYERTLLLKDAYEF